MLTFWGRENDYCDGVSRRDFLRVGALGAGALGLSLSDLLRLEAKEPIGRRSGKSAILIFLPGGPPHLDMYDLKPEAPREYRGEFRPVRTNVPGIEICEHFPRQARIMDKLAILRSVVGSDGSHSAYQFMTSYSRREMRPALGSVVSRLRGNGPGGMPAYVSLNRRNSERPAYLGAAHGPFVPNGPGIRNLELRGIDGARLDERRSLLSTFDTLRRDLDSSGAMEGFDEFTRKAFDMISSGKVKRAFDLSDEDPRTRERYGGRSGDRFLQARRLVEAGARVVTLSYGGWDTHGNNFRKLRRQLPELDQAFSALIEDLHARGLSDDVVVAMWGEFGRTPKVNNNAGRDHWPQVMSAVLAGGGYRMGQVIGATDGRGERAVDRPVTTQEIHGMIYRALGIDPATTIADGAGRPKYLIDEREEISELV